MGLSGLFILAEQTRARIRIKDTGVEYSVTFGTHSNISIRISVDISPVLYVVAEYVDFIELGEASTNQQTKSG